MEQSRNDFQNRGQLSYRFAKRYETDIAKIVRRHLADKNDVITDDDIRSVRISTELSLYNDFTTRPESAIIVINEGKEEPVERPTTPWDTIE